MHCRACAVLFQTVGWTYAENGWSRARWEALESVPTGWFCSSSQRAGPGVTTDLPTFDEVGYWSELKLEIVEKYGSAYTKAFSNEKRLKKFYIDAFSGAGVHVSKRTGEQIEGSPARALKVSPPFDHFYFVDLDANKTKHLARLCAGRTDVDIHTGDSMP